MFEQVLLIVIGLAGVTVLWSAVLVLGFLPLWIYGYLVCRKHIEFSDAKGKAWGAVSLMLALFVSWCFFDELVGLVVSLSWFIVHYGGSWAAVLLIGWLPLYAFAYFAYRRRTFPSRKSRRIWGISAVLLAVLLSLYFWMVIIVTGMWG